MHSIEVIVETPKGSRHKYKYDKKKDRLIASKCLASGLAFPYDFGYIPDTEGDDGDPLDVMIISEESLLPGSSVECEILCSIEAEQTSADGKTVRNDRILVAPKFTINDDTDVSSNNLSKKKIKQIEDFFINYNKEDGKKFECLGLLDAKTTWKKIKKQM
jgi:inorganic pyrophosphatase